MAISVGVSVGPVAEPLVDAVSARIEGLRTGPHDDPDADLGPLISGQARDRALVAIDAGERAGAIIVADGRGVAVPGHGEGLADGGAVVGGARDWKARARISRMIMGPPQHRQRRHGSGAAVLSTTSPVAG